MEERHYPSDLTDEEWELVSRQFTRSEKRGRKPRYELRRILTNCAGSWMAVFMSCAAAFPGG